MPIVLHHGPIDPSRVYKVHAWDNSSAWDLPGTRNGNCIDFSLPVVKDPRKLKFMFHSTNPETGAEEWSWMTTYANPVAAPEQIWSFEIRCENPLPGSEPRGRNLSAGNGA